MMAKNSKFSTTERCSQSLDTTLLPVKTSVHSFSKSEQNNSQISALTDDAN